MSGRLAIDFGTSNTLAAIWDPIHKEGIPVEIPDYSIPVRQGSTQIPVIPSLIHYTPDNRQWIGNQVIQHGLKQSNQTFRWMKRYITQRSPYKVRVNGREITPYIAGQDFLSSVLVFAGQQVNLKDEEIAFSVPVEAFEHYENWLSTIAEGIGMRRYRLIDEPSAAALGYGTHIQPGNTYLVFDFGGGTLHAAIVLIEEPGEKTGPRCRVLGKAGLDLGGTSIDQWIFQRVLKNNHRQDMDEDVRRMSASLLVECERVKEQLSFKESAELTAMDPETGAVLSDTMTRSQLEDLMEEQGLFTHLNRTIQRAVNHAREHGYQEEHIHSILMVGGSSQIPSVQRILRQIFGAERVFFNRPLDAIARGAAAFVAGMDFYDHIQHDYAIRHTNPKTGGYEYRTIVRRGTPYPTQKPVATLTVKASHDGQQNLGLAIFEVSEHRRLDTAEPVELMFDPGGAARIVPITPQDEENRSLFWMNEHQPTFLVANPPAEMGQPRFRVEFNVDANKRLTITVRDMVTNSLTHRDYPVVKLT